jgi:ribosomal protein S18 acetylase RimI-like enzyme
MHYRTAVIDDVDRLVTLYRSVAEVEGGIVRLTNEITHDYVRAFCEDSLERGLIIVAEHPDDPNILVAEIHAYKKGLSAFDHVLSDLTIVVHPDFQGKKIGRTILTIFLEEVGRNHPNIGRVELIARESNANAIGLYQSMGFLIEGRLEMRIKGKDGHYEADIPMRWENPNFEF